MVEFNIITGFLGSGKTTLLKNILQLIGKEQKVAIIQNEFAPTGVDGKELKNSFQDFKLIEINNGSVFCVCQLSNFVQNVQKLIADYQPEIIFLEASGLADPISVAELLQTPELNDLITLNKVITLVDAPNFYKGLSAVTRFKHQLMIGDLIIINKSDLFVGDFMQLIEEIKELNPYADIIKTSFGRINIKQLKKVPGNISEHYHRKKSRGAPRIKACVLRTHQKVSIQKLEAFIDGIKEECIRIKGFVNLKDELVASFHSVFGHLEINIQKKYIGPTEIVAFGKGISIQFLRRKFNEYTNT